MPDRVKEKLVEIIQNSVGGCARHWAEVIADGLIAHGITVQEWISVKDRLPDVGDSYLVVVKYKFTYEDEFCYDTDVATFRFDGGYIDGCWDTFVDWDEGQEYLHVTHWMFLPSAPKEG